ncbi:MAG: NADH-quinone oxidoreductase subunit D [Candidatus Marsarchaeota archaeon]|jgi:NADH-quinone oxidoreductase subunit D|nr:NADH-quinone oxidoreductase subunit D [Candidatus Marsarchaeota archaeon]
MSITRINIGPIHPSTHGVCRLVVDVDGDTIVKVEPHIGFLHRGVEKLVENRMYMQCPPYMEKLDYVAPMSMDDLYVGAVEAALGVEVKERAKYVRVILLELQRLASHLFLIGSVGNDLGLMFTMFMWAFKDRDLILKLLEEATGQRMFYVNMRLGGLVNTLPKDFEEHTIDTLEGLEKRLKKYQAFLEKNPIFIERMKGVGVLKKEDAIDLGVTGPVLRASGVRYDVRKNNPYYVYRELNFSEKVLYDGDNLARFRVRILEMYESMRLIRAAFEKMPEGDEKGMPIRLITPKAKNRIVVVNREVPRGEGLIYMVADPEKAYRLSIRAPSFINLAALEHITKGARIADLFAIFGSLDLVMADVDR